MPIKPIRWITIFALLLMFCAAHLPPTPSQAQEDTSSQPSSPLPDHQTPMATCTDGTQQSGALYRICMPTLKEWSRDLIVYAHGYTPTTSPLGIPTEAATLVQAADFQGLAFATTSYSTNGLAVVQGLADLVDLVRIFKEQHGAPNKVYLVGASEGGLITTLAIERHPDVFNGGLAMCGPYGDFRAQLDYFGDFRVAFDYFFPDLLPSSPISVPVDLINGWDTYYASNIKPVVTNPLSATLVDQLLNATDAPFNTTISTTKESTIRDVLWYNVFATNDARQKLGGQPFDNQQRVYTGSTDDTRLNEGIQRFTADTAALDEIAARYETTGQITVPLVTLHTTADPVVPYWHATRYISKTTSAGRSAFHRHIAVEDYGHCTFSQQQVLAAVTQLVEMVNNPPEPDVAQLFLPVVQVQRSDILWHARQSPPKAKIKNRAMSKSPRKVG